MAKEVLRELDADVTRLLVAGASLAAADDGLSARKIAVKELATKAPALAKVSAQIDALSAAAGRKSAAELLNLAAMSAQIRGAQAKAADGAGALAPLERREPMTTPLGSAAADKLYKAFTGTSDAPEETLETALKEEAVVDLRFARVVPNLVGGGLDDEIVVKVVRAYGEEAVRAIEASFDPKGGWGDATRLEIIVDVRGKDALALVARAFDEGSPDVRAHALDQWKKLDPAQARRVCLDRGVKDKSSEVVDAAIAVLSDTHGDDEVIEVLLSLLDSEDHTYDARSALSSIKHDKLAERLVALFTPDLRTIVDYKPKAKKKGAATTSASKAAKKEEEKHIRAHQQRVTFAENLASVMQHHYTPEVEAALFDAWKTAKHLDVKYTAGESLLKTQREDIRSELLKGITAKNYREREIAITMITSDPEKSYERAKPYFDPKKFKDKKVVDIADSILSNLESGCDYDDDGNPVFKGLDPRWGDLLMPALEVSSLRWYALQVLTSLKPPKLFERLAVMLKEDKNGSVALEAMATLKDPRTVALVLELMKDKKVWGAATGFRKHASGIADVLRAFDDPAHAPAIREFAELAAKKTTVRGRKDWNVSNLENVALHLERAR
jgi:hypothetical protein